jgi:hypothetical protein
MVVDDTYKHIFVAIARTGSTTIKDYFKTDLDALPPLYHAPIKDILTWHPEKQSYFKWAYVRNPWDRLVSAYYEFMDIGHSSWASEIGQYHTFEDFVLNFPNLEISHDIHFIPQSDCVSVNGVIVMDCICRFENYQEDFNTVCQKVGMEPVHLGRWRQTAGSIRESNYIEHYTSQEMIDIVRQFYIKDVDNFGYAFGE